MIIKLPLSGNGTWLKAMNPEKVGATDVTSPGKNIVLAII